MGGQCLVIAIRQGSVTLSTRPAMAPMPPRPPKKRYLLEYPARFDAAVTEMSRSSPEQRTGAAVVPPSPSPPQPAPPSAHHRPPSLDLVPPPSHTANGSLNGGAKRRLSDDVQPLNLTRAATAAAAASVPPPAAAPARPPAALPASDPEREVQISSLVDKVVEGMLTPCDAAENERQRDPLRLWFTNQFDSRQQPGVPGAAPAPPAGRSEVSVQNIVTVTSVPSASGGPPPPAARHCSQDSVMDMSKPKRPTLGPSGSQDKGQPPRSVYPSELCGEKAADRAPPARPDGEGVEVKIGMYEAINRVIDSVYRREAAPSTVEQRLSTRSPLPPETTREREEPTREREERPAGDDRTGSDSPAGAASAAVVDPSPASRPGSAGSADRPGSGCSAGLTGSGGPAGLTGSGCPAGLTGSSGSAGSGGPAGLTGSSGSGSSGGSASLILTSGSKVTGVASPLRKGKKRCLPVNLDSDEKTTEIGAVGLTSTKDVDKKWKVSKDDTVHISKDDADTNGTESPGRSRDPPGPPVSG